MPLPFVWRCLLAACWIPVAFARAPAQNSAEMVFLDRQIERFADGGQRDSFLFYCKRKGVFAKKTDDLATWAWMQYDIQDVLSDNAQQALPFLDDALKNRWRAPENAQEWEPFLYLLASRGWLLAQTGRIWQAIPDYEQAAAIYERERYPDFEATDMIYKPLGNHYTRLGDNEKALAVFQKALEAGGDAETRAGLYVNTGIAHWNRGDYAAAETRLADGLALAGISGAKRGLLLAGLAQVQLDRGDAGKAYATARRALSLLARAAPEDEQVAAYRARTLRTAGLAAAATGRQREAGQLLEQALQEAEAAFGKHSRDAAKTLIARSALSLQRQEPLAALRFANKALAAVIPAYRPADPLDNPDKSLLYEENAIFEALDAKAAAAQEVFEKNGDLRYLVAGLACHDLAWQAETDLRKVLQYSSSKLTLQQDTRIREESAIHIARMLYEKTGRQAYLDKAFGIAERSKATLLLDAVQENLVRRRLAGSDPRFDEVAALRRSLSWYQRSLLLEPENAGAAQWRIEADALNGRVAALERSMAADYGSSPLAEPASGSPVFDDDGAVMEYFAGTAFIDVFFRQKGKPDIWRRLPNDNALNDLARRFLAYFSDQNAILNDPAGYLVAAHDLWKKIVPAEAADVEKMLIVPDGFLYFIPFEALVTDHRVGTPTLGKAAYMIRRHEIRYAWSLATLSAQRALGSGSPNDLLVFAPGFARGERGLAPLGGSGSEWLPEHVRKIRVLSGGDADLSHFMQEAGQYGILHFSTHARADSVPRIELYDQPLLLPDIYATTLHADLVVLSACQTGLGQFQTGEGVMSLARAFAQSGVASTLSTLWTVNDRATGRLLRDFYERLRDGSPSARALRQAKLGYLDAADVGAGAQSPFFWAGFTLVGDDRSIPGAVSGRWQVWLAGLGLLAAIFAVLYQYFVRKR